MTLPAAVVLSCGSNGRRPPSQPRAPFLAATSLTFLKPRFKRGLRPLVERLFCAGFTANQVTLISLIGSVGVGVVLSICGNRSILFGLLPAWLLARMGFATIDGTLAIDFGQKSQLGGFLNEAGDILSDIALFPPLASVRRAVPTRLGCTRHRTHCANRNRRNRELNGGWLAAPRWPLRQGGPQLGTRRGRWVDRQHRITASRRRRAASDLRDFAPGHDHQSYALRGGRGQKAFGR
jgi:hypothetical protein